jgi:holo-[acyl-carrier protein] synthase
VVIGLGIDVASIDRMRGVLERHGERIWSRVLTEREQQHLGSRRDRATALAGRWAAKEAAIKAFAGRAGASWHDFEVGVAPGGAPVLLLSGHAAQTAAALGVVSAHVSITHDAGVAAAVVVLEGK